MNRFKSKVIKVFDYKKVSLNEVVKGFQLSKEDLEEELLKIQKQYASIKDVDTIKKDDFVILNCSSNNPKFNKSNINVKIGLGLFNKELESKLIGSNLHECKEFIIQNDQVRVTIESIKRKELPELTDQNISSFHIDGIRTIKQLKEKIYTERCNEYVEEMSESIALYIGEKVVSRSQFELDEKEIEMQKQVGIKMAKDMIASSGYDPNTIDEKSMLEISGRTKNEHFKFVSDIFVSSFKSALIGFKQMKDDNYQLPENGYEQAIALYLEGIGGTREEAQKELTYEKYLLQQAGEYNFNQIESYVKKYLKELILEHKLF